MSGDPIVCWELASHDEEKSAEFFRKVFGWNAVFDERLGFHRVEAPAGSRPSNGYIFTPRRARLPFVCLYIQVDDIKAKRDLVEQHGGLIVLEPEEPVPGSVVCLFNEPSGVTFAMIQEKK